MATMLDCKKVQPLLSEFVDGTLPEETNWEVKLHVTSCAVCQKVADDFTATARLLGNLERAEPSAGFEAALAARLADLSLKPHRPTLRERFAEWWQAQGAARRPVLASAAAIAALAPVAVVAVLNLPGRDGGAEAMAGAAAPPVGIQTASWSEGESLEELYDDHAEFSSSLLLGDSSVVLTSSDPRL